jgi:hypothetical protein
MSLIPATLTTDEHAALAAYLRLCVQVAALNRREQQKERETKRDD